MANISCVISRVMFQYVKVAALSSPFAESKSAKTIECSGWITVTFLVTSARILKWVHKATLPADLCVRQTSCLKTKAEDSSKRIMQVFYTVLITVAVAVNGQLFEEEDLSPEECKEAGFNPATLKCGTCKLLPQYNLDLIVSDCEKCCLKESDKGHEKYPLAQIEICECNLQRFPQVNAFVKTELSQQWGNKLRIRHVRGTLPTTVLKDSEGQPQKTLNIEKWDTDTITDFLNDWLE
ncbi:unnamed protein product [Bursaphelenchus xylophilus]|uniref:Selenoprotein F n=1 Tax=Bursaphelenchus xylophilus TaxID=6326 RepID=A0A1I7SLW1_BURXY|nr:unnamed protein product [Bursaphelenchus xylophilus]CAG9129880.1 unnamed protein product [Bursaphelenchus xylophilus]